MHKAFLLLVPLLIEGCQSISVPPKQTKQLTSYTKVVCQVKKQNVGSISGSIVFDKGYQTMTLGEEHLACASDEPAQCKARLNTPTGYTFYKVKIYTYKYPGSGFLDMAKIDNKMLADAAYAELECNHQ